MLEQKQRMDFSEGASKDKGGKIYDNSILEMFGLSYNQALLLFSAQLMLGKYDCKLEKNKKTVEFKLKWLNEWEKSISKYLHELDHSRQGTLYPEYELKERFINEIKASNNRTWYYIVVLELLAFVAYTPLGGDDDKQYRRCSYDEKKAGEFLKEFILRHGYLSGAEINRLNDTYNKSLSKISGKPAKIAATILAVVAVSGICAALAAVGAGPIAVSLIGGQFAGLHGAALTAACLAMIGGGSIAAGGLGMAGGVAVIAGGGALLGLAGGGAAAGVGAKLLSSAPAFALSQAAKLETILKEVVLNAQKDVVLAQKIIARYQDQIRELNNELTNMQLAADENKEAIKNLKTCIEYLMKSCKEMERFTSSFDTGMQTEG